MYYLKYVIDQGMTKAIDVAKTKINEKPAEGATADFHYQLCGKLESLKSALSSIAIEEKGDVLDIDKYLAELKKACSDTRTACIDIAKEFRSKRANQGKDFKEAEVIDRPIAEIKRIVDSIYADFDSARSGLYADHLAEEHDDFTGEKESKDWFRAFVDLRMQYRSTKLADIYLAGHDGRTHRQKMDVLDNVYKGWRSINAGDGRAKEHIAKLEEIIDQLKEKAGTEETKARPAATRSRRRAASPEPAAGGIDIIEEITALETLKTGLEKDRATSAQASTLAKVKAILEDAYKSDRELQTGADTGGPGFFGVVGTAARRAARALDYGRGTLGPMLDNFIKEFVADNRSIEATFEREIRFA